MPRGRGLSIKGIQKGAPAGGAPTINNSTLPLQSAHPQYQTFDILPGIGRLQTKNQNYPTTHTLVFQIFMCLKKVSTFFM